MALAGRASCGDLELCENTTMNRYFIPRNGSLRANNADATDWRRGFMERA